MKRKKSTALSLALLMIASVFLNATPVFAEQGFFDGLDKDWTEHLNIDGPNIAEDEPVQEETKPILREEVTADNRTEDVREESPVDAIEIGEEIVQDPVTNPGSFDLSKINTVAKDKNGNYYGVKTYGNSFDTTSFKTFYKITEEEYNQVAKDCFMIFKRQDGESFEIPYAKIGDNSIDDPQPSGTTAGPIFTEVQFRHHMAYRLGFLVNSDPTRAQGQEDLIWSIMLKKDWVIERCPDFSDNSSPDYAYVNYNVEIDGGGHKIYRNDNGVRGILQLGSGMYGQNVPVKTATIKNLTIEGNNQYYGIEVSQKGILNLENVKIENCYAGKNHYYYGGAIKLNNGAQLTMDAKTSISNCKANLGGAIRLLDNCSLTINGSAFTNNQADVGGAICALKKNCTININGATFDGNKAVKTIDGNYLQGGAIYSNSPLNITNTTFTNNNSDSSGGAIISYADTTINGCEFDNNSSTEGNGGAVYQGEGKLTIERNTFTKNSSKKSGGAIYAPAKTDIKDTKFSENKAKWGGAIANFSDLSINTSTFEKDEATSTGGAIYTSKCIEVEESSFTENKANNGGAVYLKSGDSSIIKSTFSKNESINGGGAIFINHDNNGTTSISKTSFTENYSSSFGGCIYLGINSMLEVSESTFTKNEAAFGAAIASAGTGNVDNTSTNIKVESSTFTENEALMGGGIFTAFPTEITNSTFAKNKALVHPQDDQTNPHDSGVGGAIRVMDNKTTIKGTTFEGNFAGGSGGAIGINGVARDEDKNITIIKKNIEVEISNNTKFIANTCGVGQGGAIYTIPYLYDIEGYETDVPIETLKEKAYQNLTTADDTVFKDNVALSGFVNPPTDYAKYTNLAFSRNSFKDVLPGKDVAKSLLNNYDVNYMNNKLSAFFDPKGGEFKDGANPKDIRVITDKKDAEITLLDAPKRDGYKFTGWKCSMNIPEDIIKGLPEKILEQLNKGKIYKSGDKFKLDADYIFVAQWEEEKPEVKPQPKPEPQPQVEESGNGIRFNFDSKELNKEETHIAYIFGYPDKTVRPEGNITRAEAVVMLVRLKGYPIIEGQGIYKDVAKDEWYAPYVEAAFRQGILEEKEGENFRPDEKITRGELAQLISHVDKKNDAKAPFTDIEGYKYQKAIDQNYGNKRILGYPDNTFKPDAEITRAETAAMLNRLFERSVKEEGLKNVKIHEFKDLKDKNYWAYYEIIEASHTHTYTRIRQNSIEELWKTIIK